MPFSLLINTLLQNIWNFIALLIGELWWFWLFLLLFYFTTRIWLVYCQEHYKQSIPWSFIELRIPREVRKSPLAMEQVFMTIHTLRNTASNFREKWWDGEVTDWFSCEVVSFGGELHFYMMVPERRRNVVEASLYAMYQDIEINDAEEYVDRMPTTMRELKEQGYDLFGSELRLAQPDAYPIRTYTDFESPEEERSVDPVSALLEVLVKVKPQEHVWIQILIRPIGETWKKEGEKLILDLKERTGKRQMFSPQFGEFVMIDRSPGEVELLKAVDRNIAKPAFETLIRYVYMAPLEVYSDSFARRGIAGAFNQYASESLNKFAPNFKAWTRAQIWMKPYIFPRHRQLARQERILKNYRERRMYIERYRAEGGRTIGETWLTELLHAKLYHWGLGVHTMGKMVLNVEELATIYHLPTQLVLTGSLLQRAEARKRGPPAGLPIYGEEGEDISISGV